MLKYKKYIFENAQTNIYGILNLEEDGTISGYDNPNEKFWEIHNDYLMIFDKDKNITDTYSKINNEYYSENKWHYLKPYEEIFPFTEDITQFKTDKLYHNLLPFYEQKFKYLKYDNIKILEVGCLGYESIKYWLNYFPNGMVYGIDINPGKFIHDRFKFFQANQSNIEQLRSIAEEIKDIDILIDDGAHTYDTTKNVFDIFWPKIKQNGYYIIEDWDWMTDLITEIMQSRGELGGGIGKTRGLKNVDIGIKHLEVSTNDNRAYALFQKR